MKSYDLLRCSYIEMVRTHRSEIMAEWQRIESQRHLLRQKYLDELRSGQNGPLMKVYLWFDRSFRMYKWEAQQQRKLFNLRNQQEQQRHHLKTLHAVDSSCQI